MILKLYLKIFFLFLFAEFFQRIDFFEVGFKYFWTFPKLLHKASFSLKIIGGMDQRRQIF